LSKEFDPDSADGLVQAGCGCLKGGKAAAALGRELGLEGGQDGSVKHGGEGLGEAIDCGNSDSPAGDSGVVEQKNEERGRQEGLIDGQKNGVTGGSGIQGGTDTGQRAETGFGVLDNRRVGCEISVGAGDPPRRFRFLEPPA
jgi:hypothetical protein